MVTPKAKKRPNSNRSVMNNQVGKPDNSEGFIIKITIPGIDINRKKFHLLRELRVGVPYILR